MDVELIEPSAVPVSGAYPSGHRRVVGSAEIRWRDLLSFHFFVATVILGNGASIDRIPTDTDCMYSRRTASG
jgi:hypothetical protein